MVSRPPPSRWHPQVEATASISVCQEPNGSVAASFARHPGACCTAPGVAMCAAESIQEAESIQAVVDLVAGRCVVARASVRVERDVDPP